MSCMSGFGLQSFFPVVDTPLKTSDRMAKCTDDEAPPVSPHFWLNNSSTTINGTSNRDSGVGHEVYNKIKFVPFNFVRHMGVSHLTSRFIY